jgi:hypothetical protein
MSSSPAEPSSSQEPPPTEPSSSAEPLSEECTNCSTALTGTYCVVCRQRAATRVVPLWQVSNEFLEDLFDTESSWSAPSFYSR